MADIIKEHLRGMSGYNALGEEIPSTVPVEMPVGFTRPKSLQETMRHLLRMEEFRRAADKAGVDTFEEADDFEVNDPDDHLYSKGTPYEENFDPEGVVAREQEIKAGFVEEIPLERKRKAQELVSKAEKAVEEKKREDETYIQYKRRKMKEYLTSKKDPKGDIEEEVDADV